MNTILWAKKVGSDLPVDFEKLLVSALSGRVERAYIFGSYGTADFGPESDVDLILVVDTKLPFVERPSLFRDLYDLYPRLDLLVYRGEELDALLSEEVGFWSSVQASMRPLALG